MDDESRSAIRGGFGVFYQRTSFTFLTPMFSGGRYSDSFIVQYPLNNADPGPRAGNLPTAPELVNGPTVNHAPDRRAVPARHAEPQRRHRAIRQPGSRELVVAAIQPGLRAADRRDVRRRHRLHPFRAARPVRADRPQPRHPGHHRGDQHAAAQHAAGRRSRRVRGPRRDHRQRRVGRLQHRPGVDDAARARRLHRARVLRLFARRRQRQHRPGRRRGLASARRPQPRQRRGPDQRRSAAHPVGGRHLRGAEDAWAAGERRLPGALRARPSR